jgi:glycosyltransferase involved in cell wall biosynthesis
MMISFVIPAHNEEKLLPGALQSIHHAAQVVGARYEIVVASDASTDRTAEVAASNDARVVSVALRKISAVRNAGAHASVGDTLVFLDADTTLPAPTLRAAMNALERGAVGGGAAVIFDQQGAAWSRAVVSVWNVGAQIKRLAAGCFVFVRRDVFEKVGGFNEHYYCGEEIVFSNAVKRHGPFIIVRQPVITSNRKTQTHSLLETLKVFSGLMLRGEESWRDRNGKDIWYVRRDPQPPHEGHEGKNEAAEGSSNRRGR